MKVALWRIGLFKCAAGFSSFGAFATTPLVPAHSVIGNQQMHASIAAHVNLVVLQGLTVSKSFHIAVIFDHNNKTVV